MKAILMAAACRPTILLLVSFLLPAAAIGQVGSMKYERELDTLWSRTAHIERMSRDGKWVLLTEEFPQAQHVVRLKHTLDGSGFDLGSCQWTAFSDDSRWFGCITSERGLEVLDLLKRSRESFAGVQSYAFSKSGKYAAALRQDSAGKTELLLMDLPSSRVTTIAKVARYYWHPGKDLLLIALKGPEGARVDILDARTADLAVLQESQGTDLQQLAWNTQGNAVLFMENQGLENSLCYSPVGGTVLRLDDSRLQQDFPGCSVSDRESHISGDGSRVLFYRQAAGQAAGQAETANGGMQAWNSSDPLLFPKWQSYRENELGYQLTAWYPLTGRLVAVETAEYPSAAVDVDHGHAIVFDGIRYGPQDKEFPDADLYARDMATGTARLVVQRQHIGPGHVTISPRGRYIAYFRHGDWWTYDCREGSTVNLTAGLGTRFDNFERDYAGDPFPFGNPGWSSDGSRIILYDQYDLWQAAPDGSRTERMTMGREQGIRYRIDRDYRRDEYRFLTVNVNFSSAALELEKGLMLEMYDPLTHGSGYALWKPGAAVRKLVFEDRRIDGLQISADARRMVFRTQRANQPAAIHTLDLGRGSRQLVYQSNRDLLQYDLGSARLVSYTVQGKPLHGALLYPAGFNPKEKYPMVVCIYERLSQRVHSFAAPSQYDDAGFNALHYATSGYFVFYPDIAYEPGAPGISALKSVTAGVEKVLESGFVDRGGIGLIGHSFGGYESAFIATQTDLFASVVAGAAVTDLMSHYHSVGWNWLQPESWRYESQQWRMGGSYYGRKQDYLENCPMRHIEGVSVPVLLWTGREDYQVFWQQSIEMFLGLKRLGKESRLLLFEGEGHSIMGKKNQRMLSTEIMNWFDRYCK